EGATVASALFSTIDQPNSKQPNY
ncbi:MAG: hypothetical protein JWP42_4368, partial [Pseudomonas sp.]|nr:hypothetical protein [Pseudomonas sp.]